MQVAIVRRLCEVRKPGRYLGFLEWIAWGVHWNRRVLMLYGDQVWDLMELFAPALPARKFEGECRVAAVRVQTHGEMLSASAHLLPNHFLIGVASGHARDEGSPTHPSTSARRAALHVGWLLKDTVMQGDCGVDVMAYHLGLERGQPSWNLIRNSIVAFLSVHMHEALWQDIAEVCQEGHRKPREEPGGVLGAVPRPLLPRALGPAPLADVSAGPKWELTPDGCLVGGAEVPPPLPPPLTPPPPAPLSPPSPESEAAEALAGFEAAEALAGSEAADELAGFEAAEALAVVEAADELAGFEAAEALAVVEAPEALAGSEAVKDLEGSEAAEDLAVSDYFEALAAVAAAGPSSGCAAAPAEVGGSARFASWVRSLPEDALAVASSSQKNWVAAARQWELSQQAGMKAARLKEASRQKRKHAPSRLALRLEEGRRFEEWKKGEGASSPAQLRDYLRQRWSGFEHTVPKKDRVWLAGCSAAFLVRSKDAANCGAGVLLPLCRGRKASEAAARRPKALLLRSQGLQGPAFKCPQLRDLLWDWFVDMRASVATVLLPKIVLAKAREIASQLLRGMRLTGCYSPLPDLNAGGSQWLLRWKRDKGVVMRKPNARYKVSYAVLTQRLRAMWLNVIRVRYLASCLLGDDLSTKMYGIDEKPLHFNEAGSKCRGTLEIAGAKSVKLKENHAATRERVSLMTTVTSSPVAASSAANMPLELLCKAQSHRRTAGLVLPANMAVSLAWSEKGSYRAANILKYLEKWLEPWTELRAKERDWRILMWDVAASHCGPLVVGYAHSRGYAVLYHYGGSTGVAQVNDTDLHGEYSSIYIDLEQTGFNNQQVIDPGDISRSLQAVLNDACAAWRCCDHRKGVRGSRDGDARMLFAFLLIVCLCLCPVCFFIPQTVSLASLGHSQHGHLSLLTLLLLPRAPCSGTFARNQERGERRAEERRGEERRGEERR